MISVVSLFRRKQGLSPEEFQAYWREQHAPLVGRLPGVRRYVQSHTLLAGYRKRSPAYDGVAELWFDNSAALRELSGSHELNAVRADYTAFLDVESTIEIVTEEVVIKDGAVAVDGVKNIEIVKKRSSMAPDAFHEYWIDVHGPLGGSIPQVGRYVQCHTRAGAYRDGAEPQLDGVALTWFDDTDAMRAAALTEEYARTRADEKNFLTIPLDFVIAREHIVIG